MATHSVFGAAAPPWATTDGNDGQGITVEQSFYTTETGWTLTGVRLYVPTGGALIGQTVTFDAWVPGVDGTGLAGTPTDTVESDTLVAGWNEATFTSPITVPNISDANVKFCVSYTSSGDYEAVDRGSGAATQASDGADLWWSEGNSGAGYTPPSSSYYLYAGGSSGSNDNIFWGLDVLVDDGTTPEAAEVAAAFAGTGVLSAMASPVVVVTAALTGSGSLTAVAEAVDQPVEVTAEFTGSGSLTATVSQTVAVTASFTGTGSLTATASNGEALTIVQENALTDGREDHTYWFDYNEVEAVEAFTRSTYYKPGDTMQLSVNSADDYTVRVFRLGWYGGDGARKLAEFAGNPTTQPAAATITGGNGAKDCSGWTVTDTWDVPEDATPGWYWILLQRGPAGTGEYAGIPFVVSDADAKKSIVYMSSDGTYHAAYNGWGGNNVYGADKGIGTITDRAFCSSYDKPMITRQYVTQTNFCNAEVPFIRYLERMGFEVGYTTCEQVDADPTILDERSLIIFNGHNEYISQVIRDKVEDCIGDGVNVLNLAGNDFFWRTAYGDTTGYTHGEHNGRVMWVRKDSMDGPTSGPDAESSHNGGDPFVSADDWTGTWQDTRWANRQPPGELFGDRFIANGIRNDNIKVSTGYKTAPIWRDCTGIQALTGTDEFDFGAGTLGMEWDMPDDSTDALPTALLSSTTVDLEGYESDANGENYSGSGDITHSIQMVRNGTAHVANFNTTQWAWALDDLHDRGTAIASDEARQATLNVLYDLGATADPSSITTAGLTEPTAVTDIDTAYSIPADEVETATAAFTGSGSLTATVSPSYAVSASFAGSGSLTATLAPAYTVVAPFTGTGSLTATAQAVGQQTVTAAFTGIGNLSATVSQVIAIDAAFTGQGSLTARAYDPAAVKVDITVEVGPTRRRERVVVGPTRVGSLDVGATRADTITVGETRSDWEIGPTRIQRGP